jgi:hypothetical protein
MAEEEDMGGKNYIPPKDAEFHAWFGFLCRYVAGKTGGSAPEWTHIPAAEVEGLDGARAVWDAAFERVERPHTPVDTAGKRSARRAAEGVIRAFVNRFLRWPPVTDMDRSAMGIPCRRKGSPIPPPESQAEADLVFPGVHLVELRNIHPLKEPPDPRSNDRVRICFGLSGAPTDAYPFRLQDPPVSDRNLPYAVLTRWKRKRFDFAGESGNRVYFCLRYESPSHQAGPFGPILSTIIP